MKSSSLEHHIAHLTQCMRENISKLLVKKGITLTFFQSLVLQKIAENTPCTAHDVVVATQKDKAQITRLINELIKLEYVIRQQDELDKRQYILTLTTEGQECFADIKLIRQQVSEKMTQGVTQTQQEQLIEWIMLMENNLS